MTEAPLGYKSVPVWSTFFKEDHKGAADLSSGKAWTIDGAENTLSVSIATAHVTQHSNPGLAPGRVGPPVRKLVQIRLPLTALK